jgi:hypothetical protein
VEGALLLKIVFSLIYFSICHRNHVIANTVGRIIHELKALRLTCVSTSARNHLIVQTVKNFSLQLQLSDNIHSEFTPFSNLLRISNFNRFSGYLLICME